MSTATAQSTIGALFYKGQAGIDFHELAAKLAATMLQNTPSGLHIDNDYDDMVIFDRPDVRIGLAHARLGRDFPEVSADQGLDECFVVSVGHGPEGAGRDDHEEICASLLAQIEERCPAAGEVLLETDRIFDAETVDSLLDETVSVLLEEDEADGAEILPPEEEGEAKGPGVLVLAAEDAIVVEEQPARCASSRFEPLPPDWVPSEIIDRYDSEIARRAQARAEEAPDERHPAPGPTVFPGGEGKVSGTSAGAGRFAKLRPQPTHPAQAADRKGAAALRLRLFDDLIPEFDDVERAPLVHRSAVNALNVAVMAFSLPVGAVLLTMAVLGRESMTFSARLAAVTGVGIGASQSDAAIQAIQSLLS